MQNRIPTKIAVPDFTPVPRKYSFDGWTAERQRGFIEALAETGSVKAACERINMSTVGAYFLRRQPDAESFRAAWEAALDHGVQRLVDIAIDRATEGVPVPVFWRGEQVGEKRWYNDRLLMFVLKHHLPGRYGNNPLHQGTKSRETLEREAAENCPVCRQRAEEEAETQAESISAEDQSWLKAIFERYEAKVRSERHYRLSGQIVAADFTLRQLTHIELILDCGGHGMALLDRWTQKPSEFGNVEPVEIFASPISQHIDAVRRAQWAKAGEPARPPLQFPSRLPDSSICSGPTYDERAKAMRRTETCMAEAQREWEAAQREDSWAEWKRA